MTAKIIQFRDFQNPKDLARMYSEVTLEMQAVEAVNLSLIPEVGGMDWNLGNYPDKDPA